MEAREDIEARRRYRQLTARLALGGVIGPIVLVAAFTVAGALRPGYSPIRDVVSDLGLGPRAWIVNGAGLLNAALLTAWVAAFFRRARTTLSRTRRRLCAGLLEVPAIGYAMASVFTEARATNGIHVYAGAVPALVAPALVFLVAGLALRRNAHWRGWSGYSFAASAATALLVALTLWSFAEEAQPAGIAVEGLAERALIIVTLAWYVVAGWRIARKP
ncbi:MAG TPA: DUF998 domain-containing protein [Gammaproteobacteria bacterium]|nr:DUF998 domain-containing protein [Gammaproteobacteria bacterium]